MLRRLQAGEAARRSAACVGVVCLGERGGFLDVAQRETRAWKIRGKRGESAIAKCCARLEPKQRSSSRQAWQGLGGGETGLDSAPKAKRMLGGGQGGREAETDWIHGVYPASPGRKRVE